MLNLVDADNPTRKINSSSSTEKATDPPQTSLPVDKVVSTLENKIVPSQETDISTSTTEKDLSIAPLSTSKSDLEPMGEDTITSTTVHAATSTRKPKQKEKSISKNKSRKKKKKDSQARRDTDDIDPTDLEQLDDSISVYERIQNFSRIFTNSRFFTSVRVLKKKKRYLLLVFPKLSFVEIIDKLITDCLNENELVIEDAIDSFEKRP